MHSHYNQEEEEDYNKVVRMAIKGGVMGLGLMLGASLVAQRYSQIYRNLTLPMKAFLVSSGTTAVLIIAADQASIDVQRAKRLVTLPDDGTTPNKQIENVKPRTTNLHVIKDYLLDHRYKFLVGTWGLTMAGTMGYLYRDRYLPVSQKIVMARMYSQALIIGLIIGTSALSLYDDRPQPVSSSEDHWKDVVREEERRINKIS
ncbi:3559_t:CDS:2 [Entrophospora sp. SA101]|nr:14551_t:CDS:2 [Entrophospora sp. SA101]CAJ0871490.1 3559_t:CDS:2 [Entrophospora sp. SA101]